MVTRQLRNGVCVASVFWKTSVPSLLEATPTASIRARLTDSMIAPTTQTGSTIYRPPRHFKDFTTAHRIR